MKLNHLFSIALSATRLAAAAVIPSGPQPREEAAGNVFITAPRSAPLDWDVVRPDTSFLSNKPRPDGHSVAFFNNHGSSSSPKVASRSAASPAGGGSHYWEDLGGSVYSNPAAVSWGGFRLDVFHTTYDRWCQHRSYNSVRWTAWESLGGSIDGGLAPCSRAHGSMDLGAKGTDGQAWHRSYNDSGSTGSTGSSGSSGGWSAWEPLGGNITHEVSIVSRSYESMDYFVAAPDGQCWRKSWAYSSSSWTKWEALGGYLDSAPKAVSWGSDHMSLYCRGQDGQAWWKRWNGWTWESWVSLGGSVVGTPSVITWAGFEAVFVKGTDGACWYKSWQAGSWGQWKSLGGDLKHEPEAVIQHGSSSSGMDVIANHKDGGLYKKSWDHRTDTWSQEWEPMGGQIDSKPGAIAWGDNGTRSDAFGSGAANHSCERYVMSDGRNDGSFSDNS